MQLFFFKTERRWLAMTLNRIEERLSLVIHIGSSAAPTTKQCRTNRVYLKRLRAVSEDTITESTIFVF